MKYYQHSISPAVALAMNERYGPEGVYKAFLIHMIFKVNEDILPTSGESTLFEPFMLKDNQRNRYEYFPSLDEHITDLQADKYILCSRNQSGLLIFPTPKLVTEIIKPGYAII